MSNARKLLYGIVLVDLLLLTQKGIGDGLLAIPLVMIGMFVITILNFGCRIPWQGGREWKP